MVLFSVICLLQHFLNFNVLQSVLVEGSCFHKRSTGEYTASVALKLRSGTLQNWFWTSI